VRVPHDRASAFAPSVFVRYEQAEQALLRTLTECYSQGDSTPKALHLVEQLCGDEVSASTVCRVVKQLGSQLTAWRSRMLDG
jgi:putative transposase